MRDADVNETSGDLESVFDDTPWDVPVEDPITWSNSLIDSAIPSLVYRIESSFNISV